MHCTELVCKVCICFSLHAINLLLILLCTDVKHTGLTLTAIFLYFHARAISLKSSLSTILSVNYGMTLVLYRTLLYEYDSFLQHISESNFIYLPALHKRFRTCRHP